LTPVQQSLPRFTAEESAVIATFDGSIKFSERVGGFGAILWQLPEWTILWAGYGVVTDTTVNGAEYAGLLAVLSAAIRLHLTSVRVFGDSRLVIQQVLNRMRCTKPHLQTLLAESHTLNNQLASPSFHHVKRVWNGAADYLASQGLTDRTTGEVTDSSTLDLLRSLNWLPHLVHDTRFPLPEHLQYLAQPDSTAASSRSRGGVAYKPGDTPPSMFALTSRGTILVAQRQESDDLAHIRLQRISRAQGRKKKWANMKKYIRGELDDLSQRECQQIAKTVHQFDICEEGALYRLLWSTKRGPTPQLTWSLVIPRSLVTEVIQQSHDGAQGGHFKFMKTYAKAKAFYYWDSMYADTKTYCKNCETCATGAPSPHVKAPSPGNLLPQRPMDIVFFDIGTDLPKTFRGNTNLSSSKIYLQRWSWSRLHQTDMHTQLLKHMKRPSSEGLVPAESSDMIGSPVS
ncbi:hypothetical protein AeRB84_014153, partial [Aphanomyces euteiches]